MLLHKFISQKHQNQQTIMTDKIYSERLANFESELQNLKIKHRKIALLRLLVFISTIVLVIVFFRSGIEIVLAIGGLSLMPFLWLVLKTAKYRRKIQFTHELININKSEIEALKGNIDDFDAGLQFVDNKHPYSSDLDIFGHKSIYQHINRTCTEGGANKLAHALQNPLTDALEIRSRQVQSKELSQLLDWRQNFRATGNMDMRYDNLQVSQMPVFQANKKEKKQDLTFRKSIMEWLKAPDIFVGNKAMRWFLSLQIYASLFFIVFCSIGVLPVEILVVYLVAQLFFYILQKKKIDKIEMQVGKQINLLERYENLLQLVNNESFTSKELIDKKNILGDSKTNACQAIKKLKNIIKYLDNRNNILFAMIANALWQWDLQCVVRLEKWRKEHKNYLPQWLDVVYEFDFLSSFANFTYNNPNFATPKIVENGFRFEMKEGGHPLIGAEKRVDNSITIDSYQQILLITGANMAGKSTFLRTIGVNMVLAMAGAVVCAKDFALSPVRLHTSIRANDSVQNNESYFFAELKRLQEITESMKTNTGLFIIIDEMLRGTNSRDKHNGSQALIEELMKYKTVALLATHDIALGSLAEKYPQNISNLRFEVEINNNELEFDYKLKTGISQNLNASFLMKKMGIVGDLEED